MSEQNRIDMQEWEDSINALLDGELDEQAAEQLRSAAEADQRLARAIIDAYTLQKALMNLPVEPAPQSLRRKLRDIPHSQRQPWLRQPRWVVALAVIPLVLIAINLYRAHQQPSAAEIARAQRELAIAFEIIEKVSSRTDREIGAAVGGQLNEAVTGNVLRTIQQTGNLKEKQA